MDLSVMKITCLRDNDALTQWKSWPGQVSCIITVIIKTLFSGPRLNVNYSWSTCSCVHQFLHGSGFLQDNLLGVGHRHFSCSCPPTDCSPRYCAAH